jgi:hypothetical protein
MATDDRAIALAEPFRLRLQADRELPCVPVGSKV